MTDTSDILDKYLKQCYTIQCTTESALFLLCRLKDSLVMYAKHLERLRNYFFHHERLQEQRFAEFSHKLPCYGRYLEPLKGCEFQEMRRLVEDVVDAVFTGGSLVGVQRVLCRSVEQAHDKSVDKFIEPLNRMACILSKLECNQENVRKSLSALNMFVNFLRLDQLEPIPEFNAKKILFNV